MEREGSGGRRRRIRWEEYKPALGMVVIQVIGAAVALLNRAALVKGMSPRVFIFYRQSMATLSIFPLAIFSTWRKGKTCTIGLRSFLLIFTLSFIGVTLNQNFYFEGLYLASSSIASAMFNLVPAITFLIAAFFGLERVKIRIWSTRAKIIGTIACVGGAASMALLKGPKLLNAVLPIIPADQANSLTSRLGSVAAQDTWLLGCLFLFANSCTSSIWLILQVPATAACPDHILIAAWTCLLSTLQSGVVAFLSEPDLEAWNLSSTLELTCIFFSGIAGSGIQYIIQAYCIQRRGPLYSAMFSPLATVMVTVLAAIFLHEQIFVGSLLGAVAVIAGLYIVLWGKSKEMEERKMAEADVVSHLKEVKEDSGINDLEQPLIGEVKCDKNMIS